MKKRPRLARQAAFFELSIFQPVVPAPIGIPEDEGVEHDMRGISLAKPFFELIRLVAKIS